MFTVCRIENSGYKIEKWCMQVASILASKIETSYTVKIFVFHWQLLHTNNKY